MHLLELLINNDENENEKKEIKKGATRRKRFRIVLYLSRSRIIFQFYAGANFG